MGLLMRTCWRSKWEASDCCGCCCGVCCWGKRCCCCWLKCGWNCGWLNCDCCCCWRYRWSWLEGVVGLLWDCMLGIIVQFPPPKCSIVVLCSFFFLLWPKKKIGQFSPIDIIYWVQDDVTEFCLILMCFCQVLS